MSKRKTPLPAFIEDLYYKRFGRERPDAAVTIEQRALRLAVKKAARQPSTGRREP
jgi:hypothetical protein